MLGRILDPLLGGFEKKSFEMVSEAVNFLLLDGYPALSLVQQLFSIFLEISAGGGRGSDFFFFFLLFLFLFLFLFFLTSTTRQLDYFGDANEPDCNENWRGGSLFDRRGRRDSSTSEPLFAYFERFVRM